MLYLNRSLTNAWPRRTTGCLYRFSASLGSKTMEVSKRRKIDAPGSPIHSLIEAGSEVLVSHTSGDSFKVPGGLICTDHFFKTALDYSGEWEGEIDIFVREVISSNKKGQDMPCLLFLSGGPGFSAPRPFESSSWLKSAVNLFRVILMDQRGTGKSSPITVKNLARKGDSISQARYLTHFRADNIVRDAELVRKTLVPPDSYGGRWSIIGQSFGGFCCTTYLSLAPNSLIEVMMTGGIPPDVTMPCSADAVYRATYRRLQLQNQRYYERFPQDIKLVQQVVSFLAAQPRGGLELPSGTLLTPRALQLLGLGLGMSGGFERLHFMFEGFFDEDGDVNPAFTKSFEQQMAWDTNPLYVLLHESIYCQGAASDWSAHRIRESAEFKECFDAHSAVANGQPVYFTGEMVYPWMFDDFSYLRPYKEAADIVAKKTDWGLLYNAEQLMETRVPSAAAVYFEDMYVDIELSKPTASKIRGLRQWVTSEYKHSGIRDDGGRIFDRLINMVRDQILLD